MKILRFEQRGKWQVRGEGEGTVNMRSGKGTGTAQQLRRSRYPHSTGGEEQTDREGRD